MRQKDGCRAAGDGEEAAPVPLVLAALLLLEPLQPLLPSILLQQNCQSITSLFRALGTEPEEKPLQHIKTLFILAVIGKKILKTMVCFLTVYLDESF